MTALRGLLGRRVEAVHLLYGPAGWLPDAPVVLTVGGRRLEVCAWQLDLSLTWDVIDLATPAYPTDDEQDRHDWRPAEDPAAQAILGATLRGVDVVENSYSVTRRATGELVEGWLLSGLRLVTDAAALTVYNALDQNGLTSETLAGTRLRPLPGVPAGPME